MSLPNASKIHNVPFFLLHSPAGIFMVDKTYFDLHFIHCMQFSCNYNCTDHGQHYYYILFIIM